MARLSALGTYIEHERIEAVSNETQALPERLSASPSWEALVRSACRQPTGAAPVIRVSRMEAILAEVFEKGMAAIAPAARSGQVFQRAG